MAIIIGDIHGNVDKGRAFLAYKPEIEHIALGDYLDSFSESPERQLDCLQMLIDSDAVLLWGNHDLHYLRQPLFQFPGFNLDHAQEFQEILETNIQRFKAAYTADGWLCTHAGVHRGIVKDRTVQELESLFCEEWESYLLDRGRGYRFKSIFTFDFMGEGSLAPDSIKQVFGHDELSDAAFVNPNCVSIACSDPGTFWIFDTATNEIKDIGKHVVNVVELISKWDSKQCPACFKGTLKHYKKSTSFKYRGHTLEYEQTGAWCNNCDEVILTGKEVLATEPLIYDFMSKIDSEEGL